MTLELGTLCLERDTLLRYFVGHHFRVARLHKSYGKCQIDRCYQRGVSNIREVDNFKLVDDFKEVDVSKDMQQHRMFGLRGLPAGVN